MIHQEKILRYKILRNNTKENRPDEWTLVYSCNTEYEAKSIMFEYIQKSNPWENYKIEKDTKKVLLCENP